MTAKPGPYVDSWWGIYAPAQALLVAVDLGAPVLANAISHAYQELASSADNPDAGEPITLEQCDHMLEELETAENWLNENRSHTPEHWWGWDDGSWGQWTHDPDEMPLENYPGVITHSTPVRCEGCRALCGPDEHDTYPTPAGPLTLCLDCGPDEHDARLEYPDEIDRTA